MGGENIEDELGAVDHAALGNFFHVAELDGCEIVVHDHQRNVAHLRLGAYLFELAAADQGGRIERVADLKDGAGNGSPRALSQLFEFRQGIPAIERRLILLRSRTLPDADAHEQDALPIIDRLGGFHPSAECRAGKAECNLIQAIIYVFYLAEANSVRGVSDCLPKPNIVGCSQL